MRVISKIYSCVSAFFWLNGFAVPAREQVRANRWAFRYEGNVFVGQKRKDSQWKKKNNSLRYFYLVLGCVGIIGLLAISIPNIYRHHRNAEILNSAINVNLANHNERLATINRQLLELQNNAFRSSISSTIILATLMLTSVTSGFVLTFSQKSKQQEKQKTQTE